MELWKGLMLHAPHTSLELSASLRFHCSSSQEMSAKEVFSFSPLNFPTMEFVQNWTFPIPAYLVPIQQKSKYLAVVYMFTFQCHSLQCACFVLCSWIWAWALCNCTQLKDCCQAVSMLLRRSWLWFTSTCTLRHLGHQYLTYDIIAGHHTGWVGQTENLQRMMQ